MLPKKQRVSKKEVDLAFTKGATRSTPFFVVKSLLYKQPQYSFIVSKKIEPGAQKRNTIRRKWYATLKKVQKTRNISNKEITIFILTKQATTLSPEKRFEILQQFYT